MKEKEKDFDAYKAERNELDLLIRKGVKFTTPKKSFLRWFGKKEREWIINQPFLGTLDRLSALYIEMGIDEKDFIGENALISAKKLTRKTAKLAAKVVAVAVLNDRVQINLYSGILASYFLWRLQPSKLLQICILINSMSNFGDFTNSIRLMSASRTTAPKTPKQDLIEKEQKDSEASTEVEGKS